LIYVRYAHSCTQIRKGSNNPSLSVIVVGGMNTVGITSVEILDENSSSWRMGPSLPMALWASGIVQVS
jgi:hypothetical protein